MDDNRLLFQPVPETIRNVRILGSLIFDKRSELGHRAFIDLTDIPTHRPLARDCIAALYQHSAPDKISNHLIFHTYKKSIKDLIAYCNSKGISDEFRIKDITFDFLIYYRAHLIVTLSKFKGIIKKKRYGDILRLLEAARALGIAQEDFNPPRNILSDSDSDRTQPYTAEEALDVENACRTHIREVVARIEKGKLLLQAGRNPKGIRAPALRDAVTGKKIKSRPHNRPWNQLPNLLWYVVHEIQGEYLNRSELLAAGHSSFNNSVMGVWNGPYRKVHVYSHLYPMTEDLIPFAILLAKKTGRNESSILTLKRDCLEQVGERYYMVYQKIRGSNRTLRKAVSNDGQFSPVYLLNTLKKITEPLVKNARPKDKNKLFLGLNIKCTDGEPIKAIDPTYILYQMNHKKGWCDRFKLVGSDNRPLRMSYKRWRVTYLSNRYKKTGQLSKVSRDAAHALEDTTVGYVDNESTKHLHEIAIEAGIQSLRSLVRPTVIVEETPEDMAEALEMNVATAKKILTGEQDVMFASCKDYYNRPGGTPNTSCDRPWGCFKCSNAIITRHVLPRVVALKDFMLKEQGNRITDDWNEKFGEIWYVITHEILPKFPKEVITEAERLAQDEVYYIPLYLRS